MHFDLTSLLRLLGLAAASIAAAWGNLDAAYQVLIVVITLDIITGSIRAFAQKKLAANVAYLGIAKKAVEFVIVALGAYVQKVIPGGTSIPLPQFLAGYYIYVEALSIVENAAALGVPIPQILRDALIKLNPDKASDRLARRADDMKASD